MRGSFSITYCLVAFAFLLVMDNIGFAEQIIYVDDDANGLNDGTSWQNAYNYLQDALADANSSPKPIEIRVAQGIYRPDLTSAEPNGTGDREATFQLINSVALKGGYAGPRMSLSGADPNARDIKEYETILSGDIGKPLDKSDNCYHVFYHPEGLNLDDTAILEGFTITGGNADRSSSPHYYGGGMYNDSGSPTVINCIFSMCRSGYGGCVYNYYSNPNFTNCVFSMGSTSSAGGGMYNEHSSPTLTNCTFSQNINGSLNAEGGAGMCNYYSSPTLTDCTFSRNSGDMGVGMLNYRSSSTLVQCTFIENSGNQGGGMFNRESSITKLTDCTFNRNSTWHSGGGIYNDNSSTTLNNCIFSENSATAGGGIYNMYMYNMSNNITLINCSFNRNSAYISGTKYGYGGGMYDGDNSKIVNCTFSQNFAERSGGGMYTIGDSTATNCIFSGNSAGKEGGGMYIGFWMAMLTNCTFGGNLARNGRALACATGGIGIPGGNVRGVNCILWDGGDEIFRTVVSKVQITYSDVKGGWPGEGNIDKDPCFAKPGYWDPNGTPQDSNDDFWVDGDYHLKSQAGRWDANEGRWTIDEVTSLCIDAGDPANPIGLEPFPNGGIINMGAYGGTTEASKSYFGKPVCETIVAGDINGDCEVNFKDFSFIAFHWLEERSK